MWINETTSDVYRFHSEIRQAFQSISFPSELTDELLARVGVLPVKTVEPPPTDHTKNLTELPPINDGGWQQVWVVSEASAEEVSARTAAKAREVRQHRNELLAESDWTQLRDVPDAIAAQWASHRKALRDLPQQPGFPWSVEWPASVA